jgi:hypothetical protein
MYDQTRVICLNQGTCVSGRTMTDTDLNTCVCTTGCKCDHGYEGIHCERATQSLTLVGAFLVSDLSRCCPFDSPDCTPMKRFPGEQVCKPTRPVGGFQPLTLYAQCRQRFTDTPDHGVIACSSLNDTPIPIPGECEHIENRWHLPSHTCGEDANDDFFSVSHTTRTQSYKLNTFYNNTEAGYQAGRGVCWTDPRFEAPDKQHRSFCFCNAPYLAAGGDRITGTLERPSRRGWWPGPGIDDDSCNERTCTYKDLPVWSAGDGKWTWQPTRTRVDKDSLNRPAQCNGYHHEALTDGGKNPLANTICKDTVYEELPGGGFNYAGTKWYEHINRPGDCRRCQPGMGAVAGVSKQTQDGTELERAGLGLCTIQTLHDEQGRECGFGEPTYGPNVVLTLNDGTGTKSVPIVASCTCHDPYTKSHTFQEAIPNYDIVSTGICHRSCAGDSYYANITSRVNLFNSTSGYWNQTITSIVRTKLPSSCGGIGAGLCRPIGDGWHSACLCDIGRKGRECEEKDTDAFDVGWASIAADAKVTCGANGGWRPKPAPAQWWVPDGFCLDVAGSSLDVGAPVVAYTCATVGVGDITGQPNQMFTLDRLNRLVALHSGLCLGVSSSAQGAALVQVDCGPAPAWEHNSADGLRLVGTDLWLAPSAAKTNGAPVVLVPSSGATSWHRTAETPYGDVNYFNAIIGRMSWDKLGESKLYTGYECTCASSAPAGYYSLNNTKGVCGRTCEALRDSGKVCSGNGACVDAPNGSVDKVCRCALGWAGDKCDKVMNRDNAGRTCGGPTRGLPVYTESTVRMAQECSCFPGYMRNETGSGACYKPCPVNNGVTCTSGNYGNCLPSVRGVNNGDEECVCKAGFSGVACEIPPSCSVVVGKTYYACANHGDLVDGVCVCQGDFVGACCELSLKGLGNTSTLDCGFGQPYIDNDANGLQLAGTYGVHPYSPPTPSLCGKFNEAAWFNSTETRVLAADRVRGAGRLEWLRNMVAAGSANACAAPIWLDTGAAKGWFARTTNADAKLTLYNYLYASTPPPALTETTVCVTPTPTC